MTHGCEYIDAQSTRNPCDDKTEISRRAIRSMRSHISTPRPGDGAFLFFVKQSRVKFFRITNERFVRVIDFPHTLDGGLTRDETALAAMRGCHQSAIQSIRATVQGQELSDSPPKDPRRHKRGENSCRLIIDSGQTQQHSHISLPQLTHTSGQVTF